VCWPCIDACRTFNENHNPDSRSSSRARSVPCVSRPQTANDYRRWLLPRAWIEPHLSSSCGPLSVQLIRSRGFAQHVLANRLEECRSSWPVDRADAGPSPTLLTPPPDGVSPGAFRRNDFSREPAGIENERIIR
jgi:hypothetical protein